jgi:integrase
LFFRTKKAAEKHLAETSAKVSRGEYLDHSNVPTFQIAAELWFASKTDRRPSHVADLRSRLDKHILPRIGALRLDRVTVGAIEKLRDDLRKDGYAPRAINTIIRIAGAVFRAAIRRGEATNNPIDRVERAFMAARELTAGEDEDCGSDSDAVNLDNSLSSDELRSMLDAATPGYYRTLFTTAFITGMRSGELLALRWGDIEFDDGNGRGKVYVRRTLSWARVNRGEPVRPRFYPPKTRAGLRAFAIAPELVSVLKTWKLRCPPSDLDLVFPPRTANPIAGIGFCAWAFIRPCTGGVAGVNFHSLRHSCASALIAAGAPVTEVQHRLGHASPAITLKVYSYWFKGVETGAADRLAEVVLGDLSACTGTGRKWAISGHSNPGDATVNAVSA